MTKEKWFVPEEMSAENLYHVMLPFLPKATPRMGESPATEDPIGPLISKNLSSFEKARKGPRQAK